MIRALLDGRKTRTRRVMKPQPYGNGFHFDGHDILCHCDELPPDAMLLDIGRGQNRCTTSNYEGWESACPYGMPGDLLWVRETWGRDDEDGKVFYRADVSHEDDTDNFENCRLEGAPGYRWRSSIHMPRWASRLTLRITDVRVQRLQDISEKDAAAEGVERDSDGWFDYLMPGTQCCTNARDSFRTLWESINGPGSWDADPWVWCVSFDVLRQNVDDVLRAAA
ncbi:hypothetical protein [Panacagrimonas sp.]|uniref:hypothetical protein n=1 Tax=Panacagrimonas sp. TaxID=2480088 RepID=UPI003B5255A3